MGTKQVSLQPPRAIEVIIAFNGIKKLKTNGVVADDASAS